MPGRLWLLGLAIACLGAGCGRFGFGEASDATASTSDAVDAVDATSAEITARAVEIATFTTTSTVFVDIPGAVLTLPASPGRTWALFVSATLQSSSFDYQAPEARYLVDGVERGLGGTENLATDRPGPWQHFYVVEGTDTPSEIRFQLRDSVGATTKIEQLHAVLAPLPVAAEPRHASADPAMQVTSMVQQTIAPLTVTPATAGDHVVFLLVNASERPTGSDIDLQWLDPAGQPWSSTLKNPRGAWQSYLLIRRLGLPAAPVTFALQASSGDSSQLQYARVLALRVDALGGRFIHGENLVSQDATLPTPTPGLELLPALAGDPRYLVVGSMQLDDDCGNLILAERTAHFFIDTDEQVTTHLAGNCAYETTYGVARLWPTPPTYAAVGFSTGNTQTVKHKESMLVVLGVE